MILVNIFAFAGKNSADLAALNEALQDLLDGIQVIYPFTVSLCCTWIHSIYKIPLRKKVSINSWVEYYFLKNGRIFEVHVMFCSLCSELVLY